MGYCYFLVFIFFVTVFVASEVINQPRVFEVDYEHDQFLKDGEPFRYISGSLHYFRVPRAYWQDRLRKFHAAGLNAISTYIEWSSHEPKQGLYDFTGDNDIEHFIKLANQEDLLVILRPGPYICAERDLGGYPTWLFYENPGMVLRTNDTRHTTYVYRWLSVLLPKIQPLLYGNGGPVIMVQVENEYGSYPICDRNYNLWLRDIYQSYVGTNAVLFTTDGASSNYLKCGLIPGVFTTVDFGVGWNVTEAFKPLQRIQPHGPLVNSEFYPGWLTHWGEPESVVDTAKVVKSMREILAVNASLNFYLFFGGTNFGFTSGANNPPFQPQITSYNYDAPITEAGDLTEKYYAIKSVVSEFKPVTEILVKNSSKMAYGTITLDAKVSLLESDTGITYNNSTYPLSFEALQQYSGFMLYETSLPENYTGRGFLKADDVHDRAIVYINKEPAGILSRSNRLYTLDISGEAGQSLGLLVENQGHTNYGEMSDLKGLTKNVTLGGYILTNWKHTGYPLNDVSHISLLPSVDKVKLPAFFSGQFQLPQHLDTPLDTFVDMTHWTKGQLYVNGHNMGRYWPKEGPQVTLYLPGPYLLKFPDYNNITLMELEGENPNRKITFVTSPIWISNKSRT